MSEETPDDAVAIPEHPSFKKTRPSHREGGRLACGRNSIPAAFCHDPRLNCVQDAPG